MGTWRNAEKRRANARRYQRENGDLINYERRIRYHSDAALRAQKQKYAREHRHTPEQNARDAQHAENIKAKTLERRASQRDWQILEELRGLSINQLQHPTYTIIDAGGRIHQESWPPNDEAQRLIDFAETFAQRLTRSLP